MVDTIGNDVKLVIWDLDETFWGGTLSEGTMVYEEANAEAVRILASRGILSSICSKNEPAQVEEVLRQRGIWDYFVFPAISWEPKGERIAALIENAGLRPENVLFIDDNPLNLEEARFFCPSIMVAHPNEILGRLTDHPRLLGKADPELERLAQYKLLERKFTDRNSIATSNEDFLRQSDIRLTLDFDVERHLDRVIDLVNRSNQLNYTKKRLADAGAIERFRAELNAFGVSAACVSCRDRYGDYGVIGFYMVKRRASGSEVVHFVFSCRTMNMGVERFIYGFLGEPAITVVPSVAYPLEHAEDVDWITLTGNSDGPASLVDLDKKLLLVGGCDLLQLSSFCSDDRTEFVNKAAVHKGLEFRVRYDDPGFFLTARRDVERSKILPRLMTWSREDVGILDGAIADAEIIIIAMRAALRGHYFKTRDNLVVRLSDSNIAPHLRLQRGWFEQNLTPLKLGVGERLALVGRALDEVAQKARPNAIIFVIGANTRGARKGEGHPASGAYNEYCRRFCEARGARFRFIDVDKSVPADCLIDGDHFGRAGYHAMSVEIMSVIEQAGAARSVIGRAEISRSSHPSVSG